MSERVAIYDTTLRDGQQGHGVDFTIEQKCRLLAALDDLGVDYIEGGWPGANPTDTGFFEAAPTPTGATLVAFGMTRRTGRSASNDPTLAKVLDAATPAVCLVGKAHPYHVETALGTTLDENLRAIRESVLLIVERDREALFDAEHFFDGYRANPDYAKACIDAALEAGARWAVLCDTNGGTLPSEVARVVEDVCGRRPGGQIGIHAHNDCGLAVANSLVAVEAGARHVQGTLNGVGERCGNANLLSVMANLALKEPYRSQYETGVSEDGLRGITDISRLVDEILNEIPDRRAPFVGASAFTHKAGLHVSAVERSPDTYEHVDPVSVGNRRVIPMSRQAGRANLLRLLRRNGIEVDGKDPRLPRLLERIKELEDAGYAFDVAEASFVLRAREYLGMQKRRFEVERYRVGVERRREGEEASTASEAVVVARVDGERRISASESYDPADEGGPAAVADGEAAGEGRDHGPVNALARALRKDLGSLQDSVADMRLVDYRVRILGTGTEAVTRVLIESADGQGRSWSTVGVSANIIDASFEALLDSVNYKLLAELDGVGES